MSRIIIRFGIWIALILWVLLPNGFAESDVDEHVELPVKKAIDIRQETQKVREQWHGERQKLMDVYEQLQQDLNQLQEQKDHLQQTAAAINARIAEKEKQLADIEQISVQIQPFLVELVGRLHQQIDDDMPFLSDERGQRLARLDHIMKEPDVTISEKFRKAMEALMVEAEYGRTIEVYQETIDADGREILVNIFRLGRIALFYQTLDQKSCGFYNVAADAWFPLPNTYTYTIQSAMEIGAKRRPVELLRLPIGRMAIK